MFIKIGNALTGAWQTLCDSFYLNLIKDSRYLLLLEGLWMTIKLSLCAIVLGVLLGCIITFMRRSKNKFIKSIGDIYVDIIRSTPAVTQITIIYFVIFGSVNISKFLVGVIAFGINSAGYVSEILRAGINSVDKGQVEAGRSLGLSSAKTMMFIVMPQAIKNILPTLANEFITLVKETAIVGYIALDDLQKMGNVIRSLTYAPYFPLIAVAVIYYVVIKLMTIGVNKFEKWLSRADHK